jgi:hypothetical protein
VSPQPARTLRRVVLTDEQRLALRKLVAFHGSRPTSVLLRCAETTLEGILSGVAQPSTVARIGARLDELRGAR